MDGGAGVASVVWRFTRPRLVAASSTFFSHFSCSDPDEEAKRNLPYPMDKQIRISPGRRQDDDDPTAGRKFRLACELRALVEAWQLAVTEHWPSGATLDDNPLTKEA